MTLSGMKQKKVKSQNANIENRSVHLKRYLVLSFAIFAAVGCSGGTDVSGLWVVDLKSVEQSEEFKKTDDEMVKEMLIATYRSMSLEIDGKVLTMSGLGESTKCNINNFDVDDGVICADGNTKFGLYRKDNALIMKDGTSNEKSIQLIRSASKAKSSESAPARNESPEQCYERVYREAKDEREKELRESGEKGPFAEQDLVPQAVRIILQEDCGIKG